MEIKGQNNSAKIFIKDLDLKDFATLNQIKALCDMEILKDSNIRIMPDMCPGIGTSIGSTFSYNDLIIPSLVSGDIGCGVTCICVKLDCKKFEYAKIDKIIREQIIERKKIDSILKNYRNLIDLNNLKCKKYVDIERCYNKLGELGAGNHFIELDKDSEEYLYITVHSGSRLLGQQIYDYYLDQGYKAIGDKSYNRLYTYLKGSLMEDYLHDQKIACQFASLNRDVIIDIIIKFAKLKKTNLRWESIHNYVDTDNKIIRKGAISATRRENVVIPISASKEYGGVLLGIGKGNSDWNYSAPHGAGRIYSRSESKNNISLTDYKNAMDGVHSICIKKETIDESPLAYKKREFIIENIKDTVEITDILIPVYNFKSNNK